MLYIFFFSDNLFNSDIRHNTEEKIAHYCCFNMTSNMDKTYMYTGFCKMYSHSYRKTSQKYL